MPNFAHNDAASRTLIRIAEQFASEFGISFEEALVIAAATMDGVSEDEFTVQGVITCRDLKGGFVPGLTTRDTVEDRIDGFAKSETLRRLAAENGEDAAAKWLAEHDSDLTK